MLLSARSPQYPNLVTGPRKPVGSFAQVALAFLHTTSYCLCTSHSISHPLGFWTSDPTLVPAHRTLAPPPKRWTTIHRRTRRCRDHPPQHRCRYARAGGGWRGPDVDVIAEAVWPPDHVRRLSRGGTRRGAEDMRTRGRAETHRLFL